MDRVTFITLGDPHFKFQDFYLQRVEEMGKQFIELCKKLRPDFIINLGDTLHDHRKIDMVAQVKAVQFMRELKEIAPLYVIIGNHDRINNSDFMSEYTPFEAMRDWPKTVIVDRVKTETIKNHRFYFVPYVSPGRFLEALEKGGVDVEQYTCGFSHQEFKNCKMGFTISEEGDEWSYKRPVITGHVHDQQKVGEYINYVGTSMGMSHGEHGIKTVSFFTVTKEVLDKTLWCKSGDYYVYEEKFELPIKKLKTLHLDAKIFLKTDFLIDTYGNKKDPRYYRIIISGSDTDVKMAKKSEKFRELEALGCKIHFPITREILPDVHFLEAKYKNQTFEESVMEKLREKELEELFRKLLN